MVVEVRDAGHDDLRSVVALARNEGSLRFHEHLGFTEVARMPETGWVHGAWRDLVLVQRVLDAPGAGRW
jgi:L-amino acid N-acyltransferase YncA